ncbi:MAG: hypothetical protein KIS81_09345 [Maricaulaceae bacterium]|nr:hypothetical protein [Maricaulaceae bacterium]
MRYDLMAQEALRGVVREALKRAASPQGLPSPHHFYITFRTRHPGVDIDEALLERFPEEMTIVLEHQFWDLVPGDELFEVTLKFSGVPKYLQVPYAAVTRFHDPSVGFHLQFEEAGKAGADAGAEKAAGGKPPTNGESAEVVSLDSFRKK